MEFVGDGPKQKFLVDRLFRDEIWLERGGRSLALLRSRSVKEVTVDLSVVQWADPVPLLSLACGVAEFASRGGDVTVDLGSARHGNGNRFLVFFARHGFLSMFARHARMIWCGQVFIAKEIGQLEGILRGLPSLPVYQDSECIPAILFDSVGLRQPKLSAAVETVIANAHPRISGWLTGNARRRGLLLHRLRVILNEALDNIGEHAYRTAGFGAIYARIRTGLPDESPAATEWERARREENRNCPILHRCNTGKKPGWLELFVVDIGRGLTHRLIQDEKAPLLQLTGKLFRDAISRHDNRLAKKKTSVTGLQRIGYLLGAETTVGGRGDFVRLYSSGEWAGDHLPWPIEGLPTSHRSRRRDPAANVPEGAVLHFSIEPPPAGAQEQIKLYPSYFFVPGREDLECVRETLRETASDLFSPPYNFIDLYVKDGKPRTDRGVAGLRWVSELKQQTILIRPSRTERKIDLISQIERISNRSELSVTNVIFVDVPWSAAIDFGNILANERFGDRLRNRSPNIFIVSQDWICAAFTFSIADGKFSPDGSLAKQFVSSKSHLVSAALVAGALRVRDSVLFWREAGDAYLNESIEWLSADNGSEGNTIWGYLDFALAISRQASYEAAKRALRRSISAFAEPRVFVSDELVLPLVYGEFDVEDATKRFDNDDQMRAVLVGSVLATGSTVRRFLLMNRSIVSGSAHLLHHPDLERSDDAQDLLALNWIPRKLKEGKPHPAYSRIANTPFIVRGGEAAIPLPRFAEPVGGERGESLYGEAPNEAYQRWQRLSLLRLGHWVYNLHHDLLTLRLLDAFEYDAAEGGPMVDWFASQISEWTEETKKTDGQVIIVYPQHVVTDRLIRGIIQSKNFFKYRETIKIFPLPVLKAWQNSPIALSPMTRELIGREFRKFEHGGCVIFIDDGIVSGRTFQHIAQAIEGLWETIRRLYSLSEVQMQILSLAMVDRTGSPLQRSLVIRERKRHRRFWRWDVPPLGEEGSCPLCALCDRWREMRGNVLSETLRARIEHSLEQWAPVRVEDGRFDVGVSPRSLQPNTTTRFAIDRTKTGQEISNYVSHEVSTSLVSVAAEISRSTTRKDYPLKKARGTSGADEKLDPETRMELLACQLLLFPDSLSVSDRFERLRTLLDLLWDVEKTSMTTALTAMVIQIDVSLAAALWSYCAAIIEKKGFPHDDALISAIVLHGAAGRPAIGASTNLDWELFELCRQSSNQYREPLSRVFRVFGWTPESIHRNLLPDLLRLPRHDVKTLSQTYLMIEGLAQALESLRPAITEGADLDTKRDAADLRGIIERIRLLSIAGAGSQPRSSFLGAVIANDNLNTRAELTECLDEAYRMLFGPKGYQGKYVDALTTVLEPRTPAEFLLQVPLRMVTDGWAAIIGEKGPEYVERWSVPPKIRFAQSKLPGRRLHLYFDITVRRAIAEVISNVMHRDHEMVCPWPGYDSFPPADMWGQLVASDDGAKVTVTLVNSVSSNARAQLQVKSSFFHLDAIGGSIKQRTDTSARLVYTEVVIPTISGLART